VSHELSICNLKNWSLKLNSAKLVGKNGFLKCVVSFSSVMYKCPRSF